MIEHKFKIGEKFYRITGGMLDAFPQLKVDTVNRIIETDKGFEYNDGIRPRYMYISLDKAKEALVERINDEYHKGLERVNNFSEKLL